MNKRISLLIILFILSTCTFFAVGPPSPDDLVDVTTLTPKGTWIEIEMPETLDLSDRAKLSINCLTRNVAPDQYYSVWQGFNLDSKPLAPHGLTWNIACKNLRALPLLRTMCGSDLNVEVEYQMMLAHLNQIEKDGLMYFPLDTDGAPGGTSYPVVNGLIALAMETCYERDGNSQWLSMVDHLCKGLREAAVFVEDRAFYPPECGIDRQGVWKWTLRGPAEIPYTPPNEPVSEHQGLEGTVKFEQSAPIRILAKQYARNNNTDSLNVARKIVRFCLKPGMWYDTSQEGYPGNEHGVFSGHFHGNMTALHALLDLAIIDEDNRLKQLVKEAYQHGQRVGVARMGWFPKDAYPKTPSNKNMSIPYSDGCRVADPLILAVKLCDAGLGDYWDDVDAIIRNHLSAQQYISLNVMGKVGKSNPAENSMMERFLGGWGRTSPTVYFPVIFGCCSANGSITLYYAWHGITRFKNGVATVNLFLNRISDWMDIISYLPYEGKVRFQNKKAHTASIRIPKWIEENSLKCYLNKKFIHPLVIEHRLLIEKLKPGDQIELQFPIHESIERYQIGGITYTIKFRGNTVTDVEPTDPMADAIPLYPQFDLSVKKVPMRKVKCFVAERILPLP